MKVWVSLLLASGTYGFTNQPVTNHASLKSSTAISMADSFDGILSKLPSFPSLGGDNKESKSPTPPTAIPPIDFQPTPESLLIRARAVLASDMATKDATLLDDSFRWIGPNTDPLGREDYLAAAKFFDLRAAFPDLEYRAHDFRIDEDDPLTVRFTTRTVGTMRGELRLRTDTVSPNGKRMRCPPEAISLTFNPQTGKLTKLVSGFTMDRLVGNTAGLCGIMAAATIAGAPPSEWEIYPPLSVINRFFGRTVSQLEEPTSFLAPFPESVMIQLAKGLIAAELGTKDPDLLSGGFTFCGPIVGPINKEDFVRQFSGFDLKSAFPDLDQKYENFRVDPYDPYRVWVDARGSGTWTGPLNGKEPNGARYEGPLEAVSFTFDDDGFCTRLTAGAVIDPTMGNTGGLGGVFGIFYAVGAPLPAAATRAFPQILSRLQKAALKPITKVDVDDYNLVTSASASEKVEKEDAPVAPASIPPTPPPKPAATVSAPKTETAAPAKPFFAAPKLPTIPIPEPATPAAKKAVKPKSAPKAAAPKLPSISIPKPPAPAKKTAKPAPKATAPKLPSISIPKPTAAPAKKAVKPKAKASTKSIPIQTEPSDPVSDAFGAFFGTAKVEDTPKPKVADEKKVNAAAAAKAKADAKRKEVEEQKAQAEAKRKEVEEQKAAAAKKAAEEKVAAAKKAAEEKATAAKKADERKAAGQAASSSQRQAAEEKKKAAAEAAAEAKRIAEEKKAAAEAAAEARRLAIEEKKAAAEAAAEAKRQIAEEKKAAAAAAAEARRQAEEEKKAAAAAAAEAKRQAAEEKKKAAAEAAAEAKRQAEEKKAAASKAAQAPKAMEKAKPAAPSVSLFGFGGPQKTADISPSVPAPKPSPKSVAPRGVPTISKWRQNRDGSISGFITGSSAFQSGEAITTSPITGEGVGGAVVQTTSGSRYFLEEQSKENAKPAAGLFGLFGGGAATSAGPKTKQPVTSVQKATEAKNTAAEARKRAASEAAEEKKAAAEAKKRASAEALEARRQKMEKQKALAAEARQRDAEKKAKAVNIQKAEQAMKSAKPGATINLSFFGLGQQQQPDIEEKLEKVVQPKAAAKAPKGVPTIRRWRQNKDGSIVGSITGSPNYKDGEVVTTSPITGDAVGGTVVQTASRSRYFLEEQTKEQANIFSDFFGIFGGGPAGK